MKGLIQPNHIPVNKYTLFFAGVVPLTAVEVSGIEEELNNVELPDKTKASGGNRNPVEFTFKIPMHHTVEFAACELWYRQGQDPVSPLYKKNGSLRMLPIGTFGGRAFNLTGCFVMKRKLPDLDMKNDGDMAVVEYTVSCDDLSPAP